MDTCHEKNIKVYLRLLNRTWKIHFEFEDYNYYKCVEVVHAYKNVFIEMCKLLNVTFIVDDYLTLFKSSKEVLHQYHFYVNAMWCIVKNLKHIQVDRLLDLRLKLAHLVIEQYTFVSLCINKEYYYH